MIKTGKYVFHGEGVNDYKFWEDKNVTKINTIYELLETGIRTCTPDYWVLDLYENNSNICYDSDKLSALFLLSIQNIVC